MSAPTPKDVAQYMLDFKGDSEWLYQEVIVYRIRQEFGDEFVYVNANGNLAIDRRVLAEFRKLTPELIWDKGERAWRSRRSHDRDGGRASD